MAGLPSPQTVSSVLILAAILHGLAVIVTSFRLWFRYHIRRLWWDDFWAALALICEIVNMVVQWTLAAPLDDPYINVEALPTPAISRNAHVASFWLNVIFYTSTIWFARLSIVCSVVRIVPPARNVNLAALIAGGVFVCMWIFMFASKSVFCAVNTSWHYSSLPIMCPMPTWVAILEVCTDVLSDIILVALPIRLLWRVKLPSNERIMILSVFSTSILVSVISTVHTSYLIPQHNFFAGATAEIEGAVSLIVCNLLVIVTFLYRMCKNGRDLTAGLSGGKRTSYRLTTVDLDYTAGSLFSSTTIGTGTGTGPSTTAFSGTNTNISSVVFTHPDEKNATFGSVVELDRSVLHVIPVPVPIPVRSMGAILPPISMAAKR